MAILGLGEMPAGTASAGLWLEEIEETEATPEGTRHLDPNTRDYARDVDGNFVRGSAARQRMVISLTTRFGSSLGARGVRFPPAHDENTPRIVESEVRAATQAQVDDGTVRIDSITVVPEANRVPGRLGIEVQFTNLETGEDEELSL